MKALLKIRVPQSRLPHTVTLSALEGSKQIPQFHKDIQLKS
jgi:hypothetical protein